MWPQLPFPVPPPLPRGPHGLSREEVRESQRLRLLLSAAESFATKGFTATSVADITRGSGVSRVTFYEIFEDKTACFLDAYGLAVEVITSMMLTEAMAGEEHATTGMERLETLMDAYVATLAAFPDLARMFLVEVYAAGPRAVQVRLDGMDAFVELIVASYVGEDELPGHLTEDELRAAASVMVAAVSSYATNLIATGAHEALGSIRDLAMPVARRVLG